MIILFQNYPITKNSLKHYLFIKILFVLFDKQGVIKLLKVMFYLFLVLFTFLDKLNSIYELVENLEQAL